MILQHIELSNLKLSPLNVRKRGCEENLDELIASIRSLGLIQPLLVRPNCDGFEVIAGQRRLLAIQALANESGKAEPVPCAVLESGDDDPQQRQLTLATAKQQKGWFKLFHNDQAPTGRWLKEWLFGAEIPVSSALFPLERYSGSIVADLFGEERYFDDAKKFWKLQMEAVVQKQTEYLAAGWSDVVVMEVGRGFYQYDKVKRSKKDGGAVYISCASNGEIGFHEGWLEQKEAARREKAAAKAAARANGGDVKNDQASAKPELTKVALRYLDLHRQNAVRAELLQAPQLAMRLIAASVISREGSWDARPEPQDANGNKRIARSVADSKGTAVFEAERLVVAELLAPESRATDVCTLLARLITMSDEDVLRVLTFFMAESLPAGSGAVEALGHILAVDMARWWTPDDAFFELLRDKPAITAMVEEVAGKTAAHQHRTATAKIQKDVIKASLAGTQGRKKVEGWKPRYMSFPMQSYTKRRGLPAVEQWNAIRKHFDKKA